MIRSPIPPSTLPSLALVATLLLAPTGCNGVLTGEEDPGGDPGVTRDSLGSDAPRVVARNLEVPWEIRFLPGGDLLVTERPGRLVRLSPDGTEIRSDVVEGVVATSESGLMGMELGPDFDGSGSVYLCYTTRSDGGLVNRVGRFQYGPEGLSGETPVLQDMSGAPFHDGCRLEFGPDGFLYVTMGDAGNVDAARNPESLNGKILRISEDGEPAPGNPFDNAVYTYGHRNPQGLAFDGAGRLWSTEHGPSGFSSGEDELNLVVRGNDYGWPEITGSESAPEMVSPVLQSGSNTWAPAGLAWHQGTLFFGGLRGQALYQVDVPADAIAPTAEGTLDLDLVSHFRGEYGRIRPVRMGPDGLLYFGTSNRDGRGNVREGDDRILAVDPEAIR